MSKLDTSGERRTLSDHADVILNDTDDGVNVVIENRDKVPYILDFNFSQTQNMTLEVDTRTAKLTDVMKVSMEVPAGAVQGLGDFHLIDDNVTSLIVSYRVRCRIRNPVTGKVERCPTARNQELDVPELRTKLTPTVDLVAKQAPSGYVCYLENKGNAPVNIAVDFGPSTNAEVTPLDTHVKQPSPLVASLAVPANGTVEFVEVGPRANGPFKLLSQMATTQPPAVVPSDATTKELPRTVAQTTSTGGPSSTPGTSSTATAANNKPNGAVNSNCAAEEEGWEQFEGGENSNEPGWDNLGGGEGGNEQFDEVGGGEGGSGFGGGSGGVAASAAKADPNVVYPDVSAHGAGGPAAGQNQFVNDDYLVKTFANIHRDFGPKGAKDGHPDCRNWTIYRWVLKYWEEERLARIKIEAEWKVRFEFYLKQWHQSVCNICRRLLVEGTATEMVQYKEYRLHKICYERADKCNVCNEILVGEYVIAKGTSGTEATKLHSACVDAYRKRSRPTCSICKTQIMEDKWGTSNGQPFHFNCKK